MRSRQYAQPDDLDRGETGVHGQQRVDVGGEVLRLGGIEIGR